MGQICRKCDSPMEKKSTRVSGNARYDVFACEVCNNEEWKCSGVLN